MDVWDLVTENGVVDPARRGDSFNRFARAFHVSKEEKRKLVLDPIQVIPVLVQHQDGPPWESLIAI